MCPDRSLQSRKRRTPWLAAGIARCCKATRFALSRSRKALLDHTAAEVGIDETSLGTTDGVAQRGIRNALLGCEPNEGLGLEEAHRVAMTVCLL
jgi:hypothetical protein